MSNKAVADQFAESLATDEIIHLANTSPKHTRILGLQRLHRFSILKP